MKKFILGFISCIIFIMAGIAKLCNYEAFRDSVVEGWKAFVDALIFGNPHEHYYKRKPKYGRYLDSIRKEKAL